MAKPGATNVVLPKSEAPNALTEPYWKPSGKTVSKEGIKAFSERLHHRMVELGLTQADLARLVFGTDGNDKVRGRDKISLWLRGGGLPGEDKMRKLAYELKMSLKDLAPPIDVVPIESTTIHHAPKVKFNPDRSLPLAPPGSGEDNIWVEFRPGGMVVLSTLLPSHLVEKVRKAIRNATREASREPS